MVLSSVVLALSVFASVSYFATGRSIVGPILLHYVFNTCSFMQAKAFEGRRYYANRDWGEVDLICMLVIALLIVMVTRGGLEQRWAGKSVSPDSDV